MKPERRKFYRRALAVLREANVPFLVGGAYALAVYTGLDRDTKDFDIFVRPRDFRRTLAALAAAGYRTEITFPHWLGKAVSGEDVVDVIFSSGNAMCEVDDEWFAHAIQAEVLGIPVALSPVEEMIWQKAFIMERERYDGADVAHLLRARGELLDWDRLVRRFGPHWRVLLSHLILFNYIYPDDRCEPLLKTLRALTDRFEATVGEPLTHGPVCQGTLLSREQYLVDIGQWGYRDARLAPEGKMTLEDTAVWTAAIPENGYASSHSSAFKDAQ